MSSFMDATLTRAEMKQITGGYAVYCNCYYPEGGFSISSKCAAKSAHTCNGYSCTGGGINQGYEWRNS